MIDRGTLSVIDNQMDQTTGTIRMKAQFPNPDLQLWPGQFVNIRLLVETLKQVVVVPTAAVQRGPNGAFVFVVGADNTAAVRPVAVAQQDDSRAVVSTGVKADEQVVTTGFTRLAAGTQRRRAVERGGARSRTRRRPIKPQATPPEGTPQKRARWRKSAKAKRRKALARARRTRKNERFGALHPAADRDIAARRRGAARRHPRLLCGCRSRRCRRSISRRSR